MWAWSNLAAHWSIILAVMLAVVALGALAFFLKNWKAAVAAALLLGISFAAQQIDKNAYQRRVDEEKAQEVETLQQRVETLNRANALHAQRAIADNDRISQLEKDAHETPPNAAIALDRAAARRVRAIGGDAGIDPAPAGTGGHPGLLSRWRGKRP